MPTTLATIERGGDSYDLPLLEEGGNPIVLVDAGKPELQIQESGDLNPRHIDQFSGQQAFSLLGRFNPHDNTNPYETATNVADFIKSHSGGTAMELTIPFDEHDANLTVAPAAGQAGALTLVYPDDSPEWVEFDLGLTRVDSTVGEGDQTATTPTASGDGTVQLTDGTDTVDLGPGVVVERTVGRPNSTVRRTTRQYPRHIDHRKAANDVFELEWEFVTSGPSKVSTLSSMVAQQLTRDSLTLDFNGRYGLGQFDVVPEGSDAFRHVRRAGSVGIKPVPTLSLRRVLSD